MSKQKSTPKFLGGNRFVMTPLAASVVAALSPTAPAMAQDNDASKLEEIVVTATRRELNLQDVAQSITAFTTSDLKEMGVKTMEDYIKAMPSVALTQSRPGVTSLTMRGVSTGSYEYRLGSQVSVYLDDQAMTTSAQNISVRAIDMERIETLPGPQSTLFGSSSQTGTLRLITNKPDPRGFSGEVGVDAGSTKDGDSSYDIYGHVNFPLGENFAVRAVGYTSRDGGWIDNVLGSSYSGNYDNANAVEDDFNEFDTDGGRIAALWNISDGWSGMLSYVTETTESRGEWANDPSLGEHKIVRFIEDNRQDEWYSAALTLRGDLGFADLTVAAAHFDRDFAYEWDNQAYSQRKDRVYAGGYHKFTRDCYAANPNPGDCYAAAYYSNLYGYTDYANAPRYYTNYAFSTLVNDQQQERDQLEIRLQSTGEGKLRWMLGGYWEDVFDTWFYYTDVQDLTSTDAWAAANAYAYFYKYTSGYDNLTYPLPDSTYGYVQTMTRTNEQIAIFGEVEYDLSEELTVIAGMRWAENDRTELDRYEWPQGLSPLGGYDNNGFYGHTGKSDDTFYKLAVQYNLSDDKMVYGLFSQGFRLGGTNALRASDTGFVPRTYEPDYVDNYELGLKSQWADNTVQLNVQLFHMKWSGYQDSVSSIGPWWVRGTVNAGSAEATGLEAELTWQVSENFRVKGSLFRGKSEFGEDSFHPESGNLTIRKGMTMPGSPESKAWVSLGYDIPGVLGGDFWTYYDFSYQSETWNNTGNIRDNDVTGLAPSWTHSNLIFGLDFESDLSLTIKINNLFDETTHSYMNTGIRGNAEEFPGQARDLTNRNEGRPRTIWFTARKGFGS